MSEKTQIHIQVPAEKKEQWKKAADEHPELRNGYLSGLIETAVEKELHGGHDRSTADDDSGNERVISRMGEVIDRLNEMDAKLDGVDDRLRAVEKEVTDSETTREAILRVLPPAKPRSEAWNRAKMAADDDAEVAWKGTVEEIARVLDLDTETQAMAGTEMADEFDTRGEETVKRELEDLVQQGLVECVTIEGGSRYFRTE